MIGDALADVLGDLLVSAAAGNADLRVPGRVPARMVRRARRAWAAGRPVVLPVRVRHPVGGRRSERWTRALVRVGGRTPELGVGHRWSRRWTALPGTGDHDSAQAADPTGSPYGWLVLLLTAPDQPDLLLSAHPVVLRLLGQVSGVPLRGLDLGPADRSGSPRHRTNRSDLSGR